MNNTLAQILQTLNPANPQALDLDQLRDDLLHAQAELALLEDQTRLYEQALQRGLRAQVDLCGPVALCPTPETAFTLHGETLMDARREAARRFNQAFMIAPVSRTPEPR